MTTRRERSRLTRLLVDVAREWFYACEVCFKSEAFDSIEDALAPLHLKPRELKRLLKRLTCPRCESPVGSGMLVVTPTAEQLKQTRLSKKFDLLYSRQLREFREFLIKYPMLGAEHPFGKLLSKVMKRAKRSTVEPSVWYRATRYSDEPKFEPRPQREATRANRYNQIGQVA